MKNTRIVLALLPFAGLLLAACGTSAATSAPSSPTATTTPTSTATSTAVQPPPGASSSTVTSKPVPPCQAAQLKPGGATRTGATDGLFELRVPLVNTGGTACTLAGTPKVAISGLPPAVGTWSHKDLTVHGAGTPEPPLTVPPNGTGVVYLTFTAASNGKCGSGAEPSQAPVLLVGVPNDLVSLGMKDGSDIVECGDTVTASPWQHE